MTGERINFLIRACSGMLAAIVWKPRIYRVVAVLPLRASLSDSVLATPGLFQRFLTNFFSNFQPMATALIFVPWRRAGWLSEDASARHWSRQSETALPDIVGGSAAV